MITSWGYEILNVDRLPEILNAGEFNAMTANKFACDQRIQSMITSITASIRNYCGWHVAGNIECSVSYTFDDLHVTRHGHDLLIQLPSRCATAITKIMINDIEINPQHFYLKQSGLLRIYNLCKFYNRYDIITINFMSGLSDEAGIKGVIASRVSNALSGTAGISSETAGGVSISYSQSFVAGTNPVALLTADREYLLQYRIEEML